MICVPVSEESNTDTQVVSTLEIVPLPEAHIIGVDEQTIGSQVRHVDKIIIPFKN